MNRRNQLCLADPSTTEEQRRWLEASPLPNLFAIVSWGCAGTNWLARTLDAHEDIFCVHAVNHVWRTFAKARTDDDFGYLRILAVQGWTYPAVGDVHGIRRDEVPKLRAVLGDAFEAAVLVRDPLPRLASQIGLFVRAGYVGWGDLSHVDEVAASNGIDPAKLSRVQRHFIHAVLCLNAITEEREIGRVFRMEDVTTDPDALSELVRLVTCGQVDPPSGWANRMIKTKPAASHRLSSQRFGEWEKDIIRRCVTGEAWEAYRSLGYSPPNFVN